ERARCSCSAGRSGAGGSGRPRGRRSSRRGPRSTSWARTAGRRRPAPGSRDELTPTERRVAELAGDGRSNKEIAQALFVTVHTVEVHLSRVYAKLGVRSRSQLAASLRP